jgi:hypothetical protein
LLLRRAAKCPAQPFSKSHHREHIFLIMIKDTVERTGITATDLIGVEPRN